MNIAKALKVKNRLVGQIAKQQEIIQRENSRRNDNPSTVDAKAEYLKLLQLKSELIELKAKISAASVPVFGNVIKLQELKVLVNFLRGLPVREGIEKIAYGHNTVVDYTWTCFMNQNQKDMEIATFEQQINNLQDEIDTFNAVTSI